MVASDLKIMLDDSARCYVFRAALKLIAALDGFSVNAKGRHAVDIGVSTGGLPEVLLERRAAARITAVDVGCGQDASASVW